MPPRILITPGEPAGIGPDITVQLLQANWPVEIIVVADPNLMLERAKRLGVKLQLSEWQPKNKPIVHKQQQLQILPISLNARVVPGELNIDNARYVLDTLKQAALLCASHQVDAIVTGPVHKGLINEAGFPFTGHTEFFAQSCNVTKTVMLFVVDNLKVALATTHIPLAKVSQAITQESLKLTLHVLWRELKQRWGLDDPRILVCGLNPHAGEGGHLGREEIKVILPIITHCRSNGMNIQGPFSADTIFMPKYIAKADVILAMYHDQALPVVKYIGFGHAVNVTLGLPFVRTSVDHGTALDAAKTKRADPGSMIQALNLAIELV